MSNFNSHTVSGVDEQNFFPTQNEPETPDVMSYIIRGKGAPSRWPIDRDSLIDDTMTMQVSHLPPNTHVSLHPPPSLPQIRSCAHISHPPRTDRRLRHLLLGP